MKLLQELHAMNNPTIKIVVKSADEDFVDFYVKAHKQLTFTPSKGTQDGLVNLEVIGSRDQIISFLMRDMGFKSEDHAVAAYPVLKRGRVAEARRVPAGTFTPSNKKSTDAEQVTDFRNVTFDPANPYHADEKKRRDAEVAKQPKYTASELRTKAAKIAKEVKDAAKDAHEIDARDLIDNFVDMRTDPALWHAVMDKIEGV